MDPLTITTATASLVFQIVKNGKALADIYGKYQGAERCIFMMQTECTVLAAALSRVEIVFHAMAEPTISNYPTSLLHALDLSLVGCTLTLSILTKEMENLTNGTKGENVAVKKTKKARYVWNEGSMNELLQQLRGQSSALGLLLEALNTSSIGRILAILESGQPTFRKVAEDAASIRAANPNERYAASICDLPLSNGPDDDSMSIYTLIGRSSQPSPQPLTDRRRLTPADRTLPQVDLPGKASTGAEIDFIKSLEDFQVSVKAPALATGIISTEGSSAYVRGVRKHNRSTPVTRMDRFVVGSIARIMLPTTLAILIERGLFSWSTTIAEAMSDVADTIHAAHHGTTLEMLCTHASGIEIHLNDLSEGIDRVALLQIPDIEGRSRIVNRVLAIGPKTSPGRKHCYRTANTIILASIMERQTSRSIDDLLKAEFFDPLEMYHTGQHFHLNRSSDNTPTQPWPHRASLDDKQVHALLPRRMGHPLDNLSLFNLSSSLPDMMLLANFYLRGALGAPNSLLSAASFKKLLAPFRGTISTSGGWIRTPNGFHIGVQRDDWFSDIRIDPQKKEAYILLANIGMNNLASATVRSKEFEELCRNRSPDIPFQNKRPPAPNSSGASS